MEKRGQSSPHPGVQTEGSVSCNLNSAPRRFNDQSLILGTVPMDGALSCFYRPNFRCLHSFPAFDDSLGDDYIPDH